MDNEKWSIDHPFLAIAGSGVAVLVVGAIYGSWLRSSIVALILIALTSVGVVSDRAAFRHGGMEEVRRRRRRSSVVGLVGLVVLTLIVLVPPILA